jgi:hypothetical protein
MQVRLKVFEVMDRDHLSGVGAKGPYDFWMQYALMDQAPHRPVSVVVDRFPSRDKCLAPGDYVADLVLEDRKGVIVPVFVNLKPVGAAQARAAG